MKIILMALVFFSSLVAQTLLQPAYVYKTTKGLATDIVYVKNRLYVASDIGGVDIFNTKTKKEIKHLQLSKIKDFMGDDIDSKIFTIDMYKGVLLLLSQDNGGYSRIHFYENNSLHQVISQADKLNIIKAKFIDQENVLLALISNDIISYNIKTKKINWDTQASMSKFSNFALNNKRDEVAVADESGEVHIISVKNGKILKTLTGQNVDNLFSIDFKNNVVVTGGQDRRVGVYNLKHSDAYYKSAKFFVYGVGLSPSGGIGAYSCDMDNNVEIFNTQTRVILGKYKGTRKVVNSIYFVNEKEFFVVSNSVSVMYYKLK